MSAEGRIFALHAWWRYHVGAGDLDAVWTARWQAYIDRGGSGPELAATARRIRYAVQAEMSEGLDSREGDRGDCGAFLSVEECWHPETHQPTDYLLTGERVGPAPRRKAPICPPTAPEPCPEPAPKPKRARKPKAAQSTPVKSEPKQSSFDDLRKEFGL